MLTLIKILEIHVRSFVRYDCKQNLTTVNDGYDDGVDAYERNHRKGTVVIGFQRPTSLVAHVRTGGWG